MAAGRTFLLLVHAGRKTGQPHAMTAMVLRYDAVTHEAVICSGWGPTTDWVRNIRARPALEVRIGRESFHPAAAVPLRGRELRRVPGVLPAPPRAHADSQACLRLGPALGERGQGVRPDPPLRGAPANVPTALTGNPLGAVVAHPMVHIAAVVHQRNGGSTQMLPPKVTADYPSHGDSDVAAGLAALWLIATGGALTMVVRRRRAA